ncbi:AP-5 complex subunit beta-1 isoform X1 [Lepisosteus oculatus]|uniref:AP-5 complex subunit beta-1 isoform X1 n=2 Tax=Lepisosteus oculatus TaxID=7918 RepID=UPI003721136E
MAAPGPISWAPRVAAFSGSPSRFLSGTSPEAFLGELLRDLRDDRTSEATKVLLLSPLQEYPLVLCPSASVGEETAEALMALFAHAPPKSLNLRCHLMLAITSVLICTSCMKRDVKVAGSFLDLLVLTIQDTNDHKDGSAFRPLRAMACDCLREMETCFPGLLSQKLEALYFLKQQETTTLHQAYSLLYTLVLKNAVHLLSQQTGAGDGDLKSLLAGNEDFDWQATEKTLPPFRVSTMEQIPMLQTSTETKELKSVVSLLLEESYLHNPVSQSALLRELIQVVAMVQALSPAIFKSQLLRLFGTMDISLLHSTLLMKGAFTDSLFTTEDENFLLKRLLGMAQHPLLNTSQKLFYMDCILHFPENRPMSLNGEESLPVLVTPRLAISLLPTVFNDSSTMLCRMNLLCLVYLEADNEEGVGYLYDHLMALRKIVDNHGTREMTTTFFKAVFLFLSYFYHNEKLANEMTKSLCELYSRHCNLAPNLINLTDQIQKHLEDPGWVIKLLNALQNQIMELPVSQVSLQSLCWHLKILGRVAKETQVSQRSTVHFLFNLLISSDLCGSGDWRMGNAILAICRNLLQHPSLDQVFVDLADLLQFMMHRYEDTDIRDHARFYYTLLTNLSREKLSGVLAMGPEVGQAKVRSLSSIMAESEEQSSCLTIQPTKQPVLQLVRLRDDGMLGTLCNGRTEISKGEDFLKNYHDQFLSPGFASEVVLKYHLTFAGEVDSLFHKLFSICLHFDLTDSNYEEMSDISVPCLFINRKPPVVFLKLKPRQPYPTSLRACAIFTTEDGLSWHTDLADVPVAFPDIFQPLPVPADWPLETREQLFENLWKSLCADESRQSAISLFCFEIGERSLRDIIDSHFHRFLISKQADQELQKALLFLPPQFHVLLKIRNAEDAARVDVAMDNWKLLPFINSYLKSITNPAWDDQGQGLI